MNVLQTSSNGRSWGPTVRFIPFLILLLLVLAAAPALALDLFTLWQQPEIPLNLEAGQWVDYRSQVMAGGRREEGLTRVVCLSGASQSGPIVLEILPLQELSDGILQPQEGQGARVKLKRGILEREGSLMASIISVQHWQDGVVQEITPQQLRDDPLISTSFSSDFEPDSVLSQQSTTRIISGRQFTCRQWNMASADTQSVVMPAGRMDQISSREIAAAVHEDIPFLGLAYASERVRAVSALDPPNRKIPLPPDRIRVEVMELVGFGTDATPHLAGGD